MHISFAFVRKRAAKLITVAFLDTRVHHCCILRYKFSMMHPWTLCSSRISIHHHSLPFTSMLSIASVIDYAELWLKGGEMKTLCFASKSFKPQLEKTTSKWKARLENHSMLYEEWRTRAMARIEDHSFSGSQRCRRFFVYNMKPRMITYDDPFWDTPHYRIRTYDCTDLNLIDTSVDRMINEFVYLPHDHLMSPWLLATCHRMPGGAPRQHRIPHSIDVYQRRTEMRTQIIRHFMRSDDESFMMSPTGIRFRSVVEQDEYDAMWRNHIRPAH